jgi:methanol--5-hydroxybenzimidazolylcobamide Co-methyltransferase
MNRALKDGRQAALTLRNWLVESDAALDPQAWVLTPESVIEISNAIITAPNPCQAGVAAARRAVELLREAQSANRLKIPQRELRFLDTMLTQLDNLPTDTDEFISEQKSLADPTRYLPAEYDL